MNLIASHVPAYKMPSFRAEIARIQRTLKKLGLPDWTIDEGAPVWRTMPVSVTETGEIQTAHMEVIPVTISGVEPVLAGWQFVARIEHDPAGNLVKSMDPSTPASWHDCPPHCAHCDLARARRVTYMVKNADSGDIKQVGSSCLSDFIGGNSDPESIFGAFLALRDLTLDYDADTDTQTASSDHAEIDADRVLAAALQCVDTFGGGYLSQARARDTGTPSTGDQVISCFWSRKPILPLREAEYRPRATEIVAWLATQSGADSVWLRNIAALARRGYISRRNAPLFTSGVVAWEQHIRPTSHRTPGEWIGTPGEKIHQRARLDRMIPFETPYGTKYILNFQTDDGDTLLWRTTALPSGLVSGERYTLATTVKAHADYKGRKQTDVLRTRILEFELFNFEGNLSTYNTLAANALPDTPRSGVTPLHAAVLADRIAEAEVLLDHGANVSQVTREGLPVCALALSDGMAKLLVSRGARPDLVNDMDRVHVPDVVRAVYYPHVDEPALCDDADWMPAP